MSASFYADMFQLKNKVAVVTGGLGLLGTEFVNGLLSSGARVAILDRALPSEAQKDKFFSESSETLQFLATDVCRRNDLTEALKRIKDQWGIPTVLVNNAAIDSPPAAPASENGPFEDYPEESLDRILDVNIKGVFLCCQVFGKAMAENGGGSIINIGSIYGLVSPQQEIYEYKRAKGERWYKPAPYAITKAGVTQFSRYLGTYWAKKNVRVNTLVPAGIQNHQDENFLKEYCGRMPMGRMAHPQEMVGPLVFLASDASSYITGSTLVVDGGWTAW